MAVFILQITCTICNEERERGRSGRWEEEGEVGFPWLYGKSWSGGKHNFFCHFCRTGRQTDQRWTDRQTISLAEDIQTDRHLDGPGWMDGHTDIQMDRYRQILIRTNEHIDGQTDRLMDGWTDGPKDRRTDGRMDESRGG